MIDGTQIDWWKVKSNLDSILFCPNCLLVSASCAGIQVLQCVNNVCGTDYKSVLATVANAAFDFYKHRGVARIVVLMLSPTDNYEIIRELCVRAESRNIDVHIFDVSKVFVDNLQNNTDEQIVYLKDLFRQLAIEGAHPLQQYPVLRFSITDNYPIGNVLNSIVDAFRESDYPQYTCYTVPNGVMLLAKKQIYYTFQKLFFTVDKYTHELLVIPICSYAIPCGVEACSELFAKSYNSEIWNSIVSRAAHDFLIGSYSGSTFLADLANYCLSFNYFMSVRDALFTYLYDRVEWRRTNMRIQRDNLYSLCGDMQLANDIANQLTEAYKFNFRLPNSPLLRKYEQDAIAYGESIGGLNASFDLATQIRLATTVSKSTCTEEILAACYTVSPDTVSYTIEALNRAAMSSLKTEDVYEQLYKSENIWLDNQLYKGTIIIQNEKVNDLWVTRFKKGLCEFVYPQQIGRVVLEILRRTQKDLNLQAVSEDFFRSFLAIVLSSNESFGEWVKQMSLRVTEDSVILQINGRQPIDLIRYLIFNNVLIGGDDHVAVSEFWRSRSEWRTSGVDKNLYEQLMRAVDNLLKPFDRVPIHLYPIVLNAYKFPMDDLSRIDSEVLYMHQKLSGIVEDIQMSWDGIDNVDLSLITKDCRDVWMAVQPYVIDWGMVEDQLNKIESEKNRELYLEIQVTAQKINMVIRFLMYILYYRSVSSVNEMIIGGQNRFKIGGKIYLDFSALLDEPSFALPDTDKSVEKYKNCLDAIVKFNKQRKP